MSRAPWQDAALASLATTHPEGRWHTWLRDTESVFGRVSVAGRQRLVLAQVQHDKRDDGWFRVTLGMEHGRDQVPALHADNPCGIDPSDPGRAVESARKRVRSPALSPKIEHVRAELAARGRAHVHAHHERAR